jgi:hypothetical protein
LSALSHHVVRAELRTALEEQETPVPCCVAVSDVGHPAAINYK